MWLITRMAITYLILIIYIYVYEKKSSFHFKKILKNIITEYLEKSL